MQNKTKNRHDIITCEKNDQCYQKLLHLDVADYTDLYNKQA